MIYYVCEYAQYPIYEAAEGGYYYEGTQLDSYVKTTSLKKARKLLRKWYRNFLEEELPPEKFEEEIEGLDDWKGNHLFYSTRYIGEGREWHIETKLGRHEHGWHPYC